MSQTVIPAHLPEAKLDEVKTYAAMAYTALNCEGLEMCIRDSHKAFQRTGGDLHGVADVEVDGQRCSLFHAHLLYFFSREGNGLGCGADEAGAAARITHHVPGRCV